MLRTACTMLQDEMDTVYMVDWGAALVSHQA